MATEAHDGPVALHLQVVQHVQHSKYAGGYLFRAVKSCRRTPDLPGIGEPSESTEDPQFSGAAMALSGAALDSLKKGRKGLKGPPREWAKVSSLILHGEALDGR